MQIWINDPAGNTIELQQDIRNADDLHPVRPSGPRRVRRPRSHLRPQRARLRRQPRRRGRRARRPERGATRRAPGATGPTRATFASAAELAASGLEVDAVEALLPIPLHVDGVIELLGHGWHVNLQKPMCNDLADAQRMLDAAAANDRVLRVMENYLFYEPLRKLKATVESGEHRRRRRLPPEDGRQRPRRLGRPDEQLRVAVPADARRPRDPRVRRRLAQARDRALALRPDRARCGRGSATTEVVPGVAIDAPTTIVVGARERHPRRVGHHARARPVPALRLLHERRALGGHRPRGLRAGEPLHRARHPAAEPRGLRRRRDARLPRARRRLGAAASATPAATGCAGCTPARARCGGAARRRSTSCASRSRRTRAARPAASASTRGQVDVDAGVARPPARRTGATCWSSTRSPRRPRPTSTGSACT